MPQRAPRESLEDAIAAAETGLDQDAMDLALVAKFVACENSYFN
jgi:hypothetical protein